MYLHLGLNGFRNGSCNQFAPLYAGETDELVVYKDSTNTKKLQKLQLNCLQVLSGKEQVKRLSFVN